MNPVKNFILCCVYPVQQGWSFVTTDEMVPFFKALSLPPSIHNPPSLKQNKNLKSQQQPLYPSSRPAHAYSPDYLIRENINYKMPFAHSPRRELHRRFISSRRLPTTEGSEASHTLYLLPPTGRGSTAAQARAERGRKKDDKGTPHPLAPPGASLLCAL